VIEARRLRKVYGSTVAVDDLSFEVGDGRVTGFLGPNGAGKSTTMRMILGLDRCDGGGVRIDGKRFDSFRRPLHDVGALLDASYVHPTRTAANHLWGLAASNGISKGRVATVLGLVGLDDVANRRVGEFSLGMKQRLGLAGALLGDPRTLIFDEPANGLDPEGIQWMRTFLKGLAAEGRSIFVSSHLLSEMSMMAEDLVVIGRGRMIFQGTVDDFVSSATSSWVKVRSPQAERLALELHNLGADIRQTGARSFEVTDVDPSVIGELAFRLQVPLYELSPQQASLEDAFLQITHGAGDYATKAEPAADPEDPS
jgi:ABC-2 type transport system ATP-binding protein